jgi:autonomous glycyl radical cofactor GrcA
MPSKNVTKVPNGALRLVEIGEGCHAFAEEKDGKKQLNMTVYSGGVIKRHWWWGNLAVDLKGMQFEKSKFPVLENHNTSLKIGFTGKPIVDGSIKLDPNTTQFVSTEESEKFQTTSEEGFPYQASMYAIPTVIERVKEGEKSEVNGFTMKGPCTIWRKSKFQEASVCVFGWDKQTEASVFSKDQTTELEFEEIGGDAKKFTHESGFDKLNIKEEEVKEMPDTVEKLQEKYPELTKQLMADLSAAHSTEIDGLKADNEKLTAENVRLSAENESQGKRVDQLEKKDIIRTEKEIKSDAERIIDTKLANSDLEDRVKVKVRRLLNHEKFVKDDVLDTVAFSEVVDKEIKDFEDAGMTSVLGRGGAFRTEEESDEAAKLDKEDDEAADKMAEMAGVVLKKE